MKRGLPNTSIKDFFHESLPKDPIASSEITNKAKKNLVIVKSHQQKKIQKISIPSLFDAETISEDSFSRIWDELSEGVLDLFKNQYDKVNFAKLHHNVEYYCRFRNCQSMYELLIPLIDQIVMEFTQSFAAENELDGVAKLITNFEANLSNLRKIFLYFDRRYIFANRINGFMSLSDLVHSNIRTHFTDNSELIQKIVTQIGLSIDEYRCEQEELSPSLGVAQKFVMDLHIYESDVEPIILENTQNYYQQIGHSLTLEQFLGWLNVATAREQEMEQVNIPRSTIDFILKLIDKICLEENTELLFGDDFKKAMENKDSETVSQIFNLFNNDNIREIFFDHLKAYYVNKVEEFMSDIKVKVLIREYHTACSFAESTFLNNHGIIGKIKEAFDIVISKKSDTVASLLAIHFSQNEPILAEEITFFSVLLRSKNVFELAYRTKLNQKILNWKDVDIEREKALISEFEKIAGTEYTEKLKKLITDYEKSKEVQSEYDNESKDESFRAVVLMKESQLILSSMTQEPNYPEEVQRKMKRIEEIFTKHHKNTAHLSWNPTLTTVDALINGKKVVMHGDQALIVQSLINNHHTIDELVADTNLEEECIRDNLLVMCKQDTGQITIKEDINKYSFNPSCVINSNGYVIPTIESAMAEKEKESMAMNIEYIHDNQLRCAIITKMKYEKLLPITELYSKIQKMVTFSIENERFTKIIKELENKNFIQKSGNNTYQYSSK